MATTSSSSSASDSRTFKNKYRKKLSFVSSVLRIRDDYPGRSRIRIFPSQIQGQKDTRWPPPPHLPRPAMLEPSQTNINLSFVTSVADPGCLSPGSEFFHPESRIPGQKDSGCRILFRIRIKESSIFNPIHCFSAPGNVGLDSLPIADPGSRIQKGSGSRICNTVCFIV